MYSKQDDSNTQRQITLWDGNTYSEHLVEDFSKNLLFYANGHKTLRSRNISTQTMGLSPEMLYSDKYRFVIVPSIVAILTSLIVSSSPKAYEQLFGVFVIFIIMFIFSCLYLLVGNAIVKYRLSFYPLDVEISQGILRIKYDNSNSCFFCKNKIVEIPLSNISLFRCHDILRQHDVLYARISDKRIMDTIPTRLVCRNISDSGEISVSLNCYVELSLITIWDDFFKFIAEHNS